MKKIMFLLAVLFCASAFANPPTVKMTVMVGAVGEDPRPGLRKALETQLKIEFIRDGRFIAVTREEAVLAIIDNEHIYQRSGAVDDDQIRQLGKRYGARYVCVVEISPLMGSFTLNAQLVDIERANIIAMASVPSDLKNERDFRSASEALVRRLLGRPDAGNYGNGVFLEDARNAGSLPVEIVNILRQKVTISDGTCLGGVKVSIEGDPEPSCSDGSVGFSCRAEVSLVITGCKDGARTVHKGVLAATDRSSTDNARKKLMRDMAGAKFWNEWVKELEKWSKR